MLFNKHKLLKPEGTNHYQFDVKDLDFKLEKPKDFETLNTRQILSFKPNIILEQPGISLRQYKEENKITQKILNTLVQQSREIIEELHMQNFNTCKFNPENVLIHEDWIYIMDIQRSYSKSFKFISKLKAYILGAKASVQDLQILDYHPDDVLDKLIYLQQENIELNFSLFKIYLCNKVVRKLIKLDQCPIEMKESFKILRAIAVEEAIRQSTNPDIIEYLKKQPHDNRDVTAFIRTDFRGKLKPIYATIAKMNEYPKQQKLQFLLVLCHIFQRAFDPTFRNMHFAHIIKLYQLKEITNIQQVYLFYKTTSTLELAEQVRLILDTYFKR